MQHRTPVRQYRSSGFPFPKQQVARINKVLFNNFLVRCWGMGPIPVWQFTKEGIAYYLGCPYTILGPELTEAKDQAWNRLKSLLQSNAGDIAAILLGFTLFSVLKPFFPQFHRLDRSTPYLQVKNIFLNSLQFVFPAWTWTKQPSWQSCAVISSLNFRRVSRL